MTAKNTMSAEILEASASGYAAAAVSRLVPSLDANRDAIEDWRGHLRQRVLELAAAVRVGQPELFTNRIKWLRRAMKARGMNDAVVGRALECLRDALEEELPEALRADVAPFIASALGAVGMEVEAEQEALSADNPAGRLGLEYIAACLDANPERGTAMVLEAFENGLSAQDLYCRVLLPCQKEIGQLWHMGEISIAEERLVTETTFRLAALIAARAAPAELKGRRMLSAAAPGNAHELGLRIVTDLFSLAGWRCLYLGANVPSGDIARAVAAYDVDLVVLTATLTTQLPTIASTVAELKRVAPSAKVLVGGLPFDESPDVWRNIGADGYAPRAEEAVAIGTALVDD